MRPLWVLGLFASLGLGQESSSATTTTSSSSGSSGSISSGSSSSGATSALAASSASTTSGIVYLTGTRTYLTETEGTPTGTYPSITTTVTFTHASTITGNNSATSGASSVTFLTGSSTTILGNVTATTATAPTPTNTQPCNNYVEFCTRKFSNITVVGCHNSPFVRAGSAAANQMYPVKTQLDDGVRFVQAQIQWPTNGTVPHFCHTSCDILDAGPIADWLGQVKEWVADHPYDVVTVLLGNGNYSTPDLYVPFIEESGITDYVYYPPQAPMALGDWPTMEELIITGKRVIMFLDYMANQTAYPWLMDEFSQMWETPFDPTDMTFPCTVSRPPDLSTADAENRLYLMNHNLNVEVSLLGASILVPAVSLLNETNNVTGYGSLGVAADTCRSAYAGRPPNILNVDYYNYGNTTEPGSVFQVAALMNNVTYTGTCCGLGESAAGHTVTRPGVTQSALAAALAWTVLWVLV